MPTYEYECEEGHTVEVQQSIKDEPIKECLMFINPDEPEQCKAPCKRIINFQGGVAFKGSGWTPKFH